MKAFRKVMALILALTICLGMALSLASCGGGKDDETVTVTDMLGETHEVKKNPTKVACASRTTYDLLVAFGLGDWVPVGKKSNAYDAPRALTDSVSVMDMARKASDHFKRYKITIL